MTFKDYIITFYGKKIYDDTKKLQDLKIRNANLKNQLVFLQKCLSNNITPKSFKIKNPIHTKKAKNTMKEYSKKLLLHARNEAKHRLYSSKILINELNIFFQTKVKLHEYELQNSLTNKSKNYHYIKKKTETKERYHKLHITTIIKNTFNPPNQVIKPAILNLTNVTLDKSTTELLNIGLNFVPLPKKISHMDIITNIETCALQLEKLQKPTQIYPFNKSTGFALLNQKDASLKLEEQIKNIKIIDYDPTSTFTTKFQIQLCKLRKEGKLDTKTYFKMYPSDCNPPRIYGMIKAHKPEKDYPMRPIVSTINTPPYGSSNYLVKNIQPTLNKNKSRLMNSSSFVNEAKQWIIDPNEVQVSFDIVNLYPSVPFDEAIPVIIDILNADIIDDLKTRTKLTLADIHQLVEFLLSICYFLYENSIRIIPNLGPIGLSLMVVMAEAFLQNIERKALNIAIIHTSEPKSYKRYVDDCHARFASIKQQQMFLNILNKQHPAIKYTVELENDLKQLNFLDINITNLGSNTYEFQIHRKEAIKNV
ncbi:uncharacterized protein LOC136093107 [Hydra vulgaris]|uniref:uncharacterized protein LOC136093107 n=1 Tax=Hydra vulgaris TaxID=6087 RepID=UPI0032E9E31C